MRQATRRSRFVRARTVNLWHGGAHWPQVGRDLTAMVNDVEQKAPRHRRGWTLAAEELERAFPAARRQPAPALGEGSALLLVRCEHFAHGRRRGRGLPFGRTALECLNNHGLFTDDLPRACLCRTRRRIGTVIGPFGNTREHVAGGFRLVRPEPGEQRFLVHAVSCARKYSQILKRLLPIAFPRPVPAY